MKLHQLLSVLGAIIIKSLREIVSDIILAFYLLRLPLTSRPLKLLRSNCDAITSVGLSWGGI